MAALTLIAAVALATLAGCLIAYGIALAWYAIKERSEAKLDARLRDHGQ